MSETPSKTFWQWLKYVAKYATGAMRDSATDALVGDCCRSETPEELIEHFKHVHSMFETDWAFQGLTEIQEAWHAVH